MRILRPAVALGLVATSALLAGCEKPVPGATVFSGTKSERLEALCGTADLAPVTARECAVDTLETDEGLSRLAVRGNTTVGVSVDPAIAEQGWSVQIGDQTLTAAPVTSTYFRFTFPETQFPPNGYVMKIVAGTNNEIRGLWAIRLSAPA